MVRYKKEPPPIWQIYTLPVFWIGIIWMAGVAIVPRMMIVLYPEQAELIASMNKTIQITEDIMFSQSDSLMIFGVVLSFLPYWPRFPGFLGKIASNISGIMTAVFRKGPPPSQD